MPHRDSISLDDGYDPEDYDRARTEYIDDPGDYIDPDTPARVDEPRRSRIPAHAPQPQDYKPKRRKPKRRGPVPRERVVVDEREPDHDEFDRPRDDESSRRPRRDEDGRYEDERPRRRYEDDDDRPRRSEDAPRPRRRGDRYYDRTDGPVRREASGVDVVDVHHDGATWTIPADVLDWSIDATVAFEEGRAVSAVRNLLGERQYRELIKRRYTNRDFRALFDKLAKAGGFETAGN